MTNSSAMGKWRVVLGAAVVMQQWDNATETGNAVLTRAGLKNRFNGIKSIFL